VCGLALNRVAARLPSRRRERVGEGEEPAVVGVGWGWLGVGLDGVRYLTCIQRFLALALAKGTLSSSVRSCRPPLDHISRVSLVR
jgi:hypothetical protein